MPDPKPSLPAAPITATIHRLGGLGDGIGEWNGAPLLIPGTVAGDTVQARITHIEGGRYHGKLITVISPGPTRRTPPCLHHMQCGGCALQQVSDEAYQEFKRITLREALRKGNINADATPIDLTFLTPAARRRAEFSLLREQGSVIPAYMAPRSHHLIGITQCMVLAPALQRWLADAPKRLQPVHDLRMLNRLQITLADDESIDLLFSSESELPHAVAKRISHLADTLGAARVSHRDHLGATHTLWQLEEPVITFGAYSIALPPGAFLQASKAGEECMAAAITAAIPAGAQLMDGFCGLGTWSFYAARKAAAIHAYESNPALISALQKAAAQYRLFLKAQQRDIFTHPLTASELKRFDTVILNPPRTGAKAQTAAVAASAVSHVILVSCNPATFSRDASTLIRSGYRCTSAIGIDQFTWSAHLEIVAVFKR